MKKKSKIKVLKDNQINDSYTFVINLDSSLNHNLQETLNNNETEDDTGAADIDSMNKIYKKKKVLTNEDVRKASRGLRFNNPSQRNHSSIYE